MVEPRSGRRVSRAESDGLEKTHTVRRTLFESSLGLVEDYRCVGAGRRRTPDGHSPDFQVGLPYDGVFVWHVGREEVVTDANQVLFVAGGEDFHLSEPVPGGYAELIITPARSLLSEILAAGNTHLSSHPMFRRRRRLADARLQLVRAKALHAMRAGHWNGLPGDEALVHLLCSSLDAAPQPHLNGATRRLVDRTKQFLGAHLSETLHLAHVAQAVGSSPAYLTDVFRRIEGLSLHRYLVRLRLARALVELPHTDDLTTLALDLGFSSHSHFTASFRSTFGCAPSVFRRSTRIQQRDARA
jgi:AraC family transcriptional regulator